MTQTPSLPRNDVLAGSLYMLASGLCFGVLHGSVRYISGEIHPFEITFFRNLLGLFVIAPWFFTRGLAPLRTTRFSLHLVRALCNVVAMLMFFSALALSPLVQVQALGFTAPLFTTVLAIFVLGEKVRLRRWTALLAGFVGALVIIRPGVQAIDVGAMLTLGSAAIWAYTMIVIKLLSRTDSSVTITTYMVLLMSPLSLVPALWVWQWPAGEQWLWLLLCGVSGTGAQLLMTQAFRVADASVVLPFDFTKVIWGALIAYFAFNELVDIWTWVGALIIFGGAMYITYRERHLASAKPAGGRD